MIHNEIVFVLPLLVATIYGCYTRKILYCKYDFLSVFLKKIKNKNAPSNIISKLITLNGFLNFSNINYGSVYN